MLLRQVTKSINTVYYNKQKSRNMVRNRRRFLLYFVYDDGIFGILNVDDLRNFFSVRGRCKPLLSHRSLLLLG